MRKSGAKIPLEKLQSALSGDSEAVHFIVRALTSIIHARVARELLKRRAAALGRNPQQEVEDLVQEVFVALFERDGRILRSWIPERGLSLENFVGMVAEQQVISILRTGKRNPWRESPTPDSKLECPTSTKDNPEQLVATRELYARVLEQLQSELSPVGQDIFQRLYVQYQSVKEVCAALSMTPEAVYAWRSRLKRMAGQISGRISAREPGLCHQEVGS